MKIDKSAETGLFIAAAIALSIATWPISFTLGAYGEIFYREAFTVWAASLAALVAGGYSWLFQSGERHISWWGAILLLVPSIFVFWVVLGIENDSLIANLLELILLFGSTPYIAYILLSIVVPDAVSLKSKRDMIGLVACFLIVNGASYAIGANNAYFMILIFWFLIIRPQMKRAKEHQQKVEGLKKGDQVVTQGGLVGKIAKVDDVYVEIDLAKDVRVKAVKQTIGEVIPPGGSAAND